jgi:hypothetical protein
MVESLQHRACGPIQPRLTRHQPLQNLNYTTPHTIGILLTLYTKNVDDSIYPQRRNVLRNRSLHILGQGRKQTNIVHRSVRLASCVIHQSHKVLCFFRLTVDAEAR